MTVSTGRQDVEITGAGTDDETVVFGVDTDPDTVTFSL